MNAPISSIALVSLFPSLVLGAAPGRALMIHAHDDHGLHAHAIPNGHDAVRWPHSHPTDGQAAPSESETEPAPSTPPVVISLAQSHHAPRSLNGAAFASLSSKCHALPNQASSGASEYRQPTETRAARLFPPGSILSDASARLLLANHAFLL